MKILGIDPGTTSIGYAVIETAPTPVLLTSGLVSIRSMSDAERLQELYHELQKLIKKWGPKLAAIEKLFFAKNVKTAIAVSQARGVAMLTTSLAELKVYEYTPLEIKKVITGDGKADKAQVQKMVKV
ncbi:MAG: crossover junction endodeoxyribonuclease RuvC, partial [bacterium]|nr:crossover junction endodeoxyribonuclease RuvC [bacterium]